MLDALQRSGLRLSLDEGRIAVTGHLTNEQRRTINKNKPVLKAELRRAAVLKMMAEDDQPRKYYWVTDDKAHPEFVFLTLAIRDIGTCEMSMPKEKYDPFLLMEILDTQTRSGVDS